MKKPILAGVVVLAIAAVLVFTFGRGGAGAADALVASGTVEATEADLAFRTPGRIESIEPREGDAVSGGEALAWLDDRDATSAREAAAARVDAAAARLAELQAGARPQELAQARAALASAEARRAEAARDAERARRLFEGGAVSRQALDRAETALEVARSAAAQAGEQLDLVRQGPRAETLAAQRAGLEQARAELDRADAALDHGRIEAPFPGVVTVRHRQAGEVVAAGAPILTILDPTDRWVRIYVREDRIGRVALGMPARIVSDTWPDRVYDGEVVFIGSEAEFTPRNVQTPDERTKLVYPVKIRITGDPGFELKPGIPADVTLVEGD